MGREIRRVDLALLLVGLALGEQQHVVARAEVAQRLGDAGNQLHPVVHEGGGELGDRPTSASEVGRRFNRSKQSARLRRKLALP